MCGVATVRVSTHDRSKWSRATPIGAGRSIRCRSIFWVPFTTTPRQLARLAPCFLCYSRSLLKFTLLQYCVDACSKDKHKQASQQVELIDSRRKLAPRRSRLAHSRSRQSHESFIQMERRGAMDFRLGRRHRAFSPFTIAPRSIWPVALHLERT